MLAMALGQVTNLCGCVRSTVGAGLARDGFVLGDVFWRVYISVAAVMADIGSALTAGHLEKRQVTKRLRP